MKKYFLLLFAMALLSCRSNRTDSQDPAALQTGDLVFVAIPADYAVNDSMAEAIAASTSRDTLRIIHVAIADVDSLGSPWIIDATIAHGVDRHPLDTLFADFALREGRATYIVKRLSEEYPLEDFVNHAKAFCGQPYDTHFLPDNGALYCSELVRESYRLPDGSILFENAPMNFKDERGEFPPYWIWLFDLLGEPIPQDVPGSNPAAMITSPLLRDTEVAL